MIDIAATPALIDEGRGGFGGPARLVDVTCPGMTDARPRQRPGIQGEHDREATLWVEHRHQITAGFTPCERGSAMAARNTRQTSSSAASAASRTLRSSSSSRAARSAAASALSQTGNSRVTGAKAASAAGKTLASPTSSKAARLAAASDLSQRGRSK